MYIVAIVSLSAMMWMLIIYRRMQAGEEIAEDQTSIVKQEMDGKALPEIKAPVINPGQAPLLLHLACNSSGNPLPPPQATVPTPEPVPQVQEIKDSDDPREIHRFLRRVFLRDGRRAMEPLRLEVFGFSKLRRECLVECRRSCDLTRKNGESVNQMTIPVVEVAIVIESHINQLLPKLIEYSQKNSFQLSPKITQRWELDVGNTAYSNSNFSIEKVLDIIDKDRMDIFLH